MSIGWLVMCEMYRERSDAHAVADAGAVLALLAGGNRSSSKRTEQAAGRLQETSVGDGAGATATAQTADAARTADDLACSVSEAAQRGGEAVIQVVEKMGSVSASSQRVAEITAVIDRGQDSRPTCSR